MLVMVHLTLASCISEHIWWMYDNLEDIRFTQPNTLGYWLLSISQSQKHLFIFFVVESGILSPQKQHSCFRKHTGIFYVWFQIQTYVSHLFGCYLNTEKYNRKFFYWKNYLVSARNAAFIIGFFWFQLKLTNS